MRDNNRPATPSFDEHESQPPAPVGVGPSPAAGIAMTLVVPAVVGLGAGAGIVAAAVAWGAAEAAVGVGAAYLVYSTLSGRAGDLTAAVRLAVHVIAVTMRAHPAERGAREPE
jgi:hypothetical protein